MATMFEGEFDEVEKRLSSMSMEEFLRQLPNDDTIRRITNNDRTLFLLMTPMTKPPLNFLAVYLVQKDGRIIFCFRAHQGKGFIRPSYGFLSYNYNRKKDDVTVEELLLWINKINIPCVSDFVLHILEAKQQLKPDSGCSSSRRFPVRFSPYSLDGA